MYAIRSYYAHALARSHALTTTALSALRNREAGHCDSTCKYNSCTHEFQFQHINLLMLNGAAVTHCYDRCPPKQKRDWRHMLTGP